MNTEKICKLYESNTITQVTGESIRPGGFKLTDRAMDFCTLQPGSRVLDVGCGTGATVEYLTDKYHLNAVGVDPSAILLEKGRQRKPALPVFQAVGECLPFQDGEMNCVFTECSLSLMINLDSALKEFYRVLEDNGLLVATDIYARNQAGVSQLQSLPLESCLTGAMSQEDLFHRVKSAGFKIVLWEDHSNLLKELVGRLIFAHGSMEDFWQNSATSEIDVSYLKETIAGSKPGYYLLIAQKQGK